MIVREVKNVFLFFNWSLILFGCIFCNKLGILELVKSLEVKWLYKMHKNTSNYDLNLI